MTQVPLNSSCDKFMKTFCKYYAILNNVVQINLNVIIFMLNSFLNDIK